MVRKAAKKAASPSSVIYPEGCESIDLDPETNNSKLVLALKVRLILYLSKAFFKGFIRANERG